MNHICEQESICYALILLSLICCIHSATIIHCFCRECEKGVVNTGKQQLQESIKICKKHKKILTFFLLTSNCQLFSFSLMFQIKHCQIQNVLCITLANAEHVIDWANSFVSGVYWFKLSISLAFGFVFTSSVICIHSWSIMICFVRCEMANYVM